MNYTDKIYFMKQGTTSENQLWTYNDISYVKIEAVGNTGGISGSEISVIAPPGDNIDIGMTEDNIPTIGILDKDYLYDAESNEIIKAGSVIIAGDYRGEPAFNILTISDANDIKKRYEGYELLFAEVNEDKSVYEVLKGTWMYILTQEQYEEMRANTNGIRANLYRVNNAYDNTDERLTSTSKKVTNLPAYEDLKQMSIKEN